MSGVIFPPLCDKQNCTKLHRQYDGLNFHKGQLYVQLLDQKEIKGTVRSFYFYTPAQIRRYEEVSEKIFFSSLTKRRNSTGQLLIDSSQKTGQMKKLDEGIEDYPFDNITSGREQILLGIVHKILLKHLANHPIKGNGNLAKNQSVDDLTYEKPVSI